MLTYPRAKKPLADHLYAHSGFRDRNRSRCYLSAEVETQEGQIAGLEDELRASDRKVRQLKAEVARLKVSVLFGAILNRADPSRNMSSI